MAKFQYKAVDRNGAKKKGSLEAEDLGKARLMLKSQGLIPVEVKAETLLNRDWSFDMAPKKKDIAMLCKQFASLLKAGVNLTDTLELLVGTVSNKTLIKALRGTRQSVQKGESLANAMRAYPKCFDTMMINMVDAGEASGSLDITFQRIADQIEKSDKIASAIKSAMVYPAIVGVVAIIVVIVLLTMVVPSFMNMFADLDTEMPKITQIVVAMSDFMKSHILVVLIGAAVLIFGAIKFKKSLLGKKVISFVMLKTPVLKNFTINGQSSKFARTLSSMESAGLTLTNSLDITAGVMTNYRYEVATKKLKELVATGVPLAEAMEQQNIYPNMLTHMVAIGEDTGDLPNMLEKTADYYDEQVSNATAGLMAAMSPATIVGLLVIVGPILAAVLAPMLSLYTNMDNL